MKAISHARMLVCSAVVSAAAAPHAAAQEAEAVPGPPGVVEESTPAPVPPVRRSTGFLGVTICEVRPEVRAQTRLAEGEGLMVALVAQGSPAARAGLRPYDILLRFDDQQLVSVFQFVSLVESAGAGREADLTVLRRGEEIRLHAVLEEAPAATVARDPAEPKSTAGMLAAITRTLQENPSAVEAVYRMLHVSPAVSPSLPSASPALDVVEVACEGLTLEDDEGVVEISMKNGRRLVRIAAPDGRELYSGALATPADLLAVPASLRPRVEKLELQATELLRNHRAQSAPDGGE